MATSARITTGGHIRKRAGKTGVRWQVIVSYRRDGRRKTISATCSTHAEAKRKLRELLDLAESRAEPTATHDATSPGIRRRGTIKTVAQLLDAFEKIRVNTKWDATTQRQWVSQRKRHYDPTWGTRFIDDVTIFDVEAWLQDLAAGTGTATKPLSLATIKRLVNPLASAFDYAVRHGYSTSNPFRSPEWPVAETKGKPEMDYPDPLDVMRVLEVLRNDPVAYVACQMAADCGLRRGELCAIRFSDIDFESGILSIRRRASIGREDKLVLQDGTKTSSFGRQLVLATATLNLLSEYQRFAMDEAARVGVPWSDNVFVFSTPGEPLLPMRPDLLTHRWARACESAGVELRLHDLRHMHVTLLLAAGSDVATVAKRVGHSGGRMTLEVYAHRLREIERAAAEIAAQGTRLVDPQSTEGGE